MNYHASNSKLTAEQKEDFKILKAEAEMLGVTVVQVGAVTVAYRRGPTVTRFAVSVASPKERKIRPKVGKFYALLRCSEGQATILPNDVFSDLLQDLEEY